MLMGLSSEELRLISIAIAEHVCTLKEDIRHAEIVPEYTALLNKIDRHRALPE